MSGLLVWQLWDVTPARWCAIAQATDERANVCVAILLRLLDLKDHVVLGLLSIVGLTVLALAVVALNVRIGATGPAGIGVNIGDDDDDDEFRCRRER